MSDADADPRLRELLALRDTREPVLVVAAAIFQLAILAWMILGR